MICGNDSTYSIQFLDVLSIFVSLVPFKGKQTSLG